jgi:enamine deaminase RidA (YjgF/YER057c/UK114 family)
MAGRIEAKLKELGIALPPAAKPIANYVPFTVSRRLVVVSGQLPMRDGKVAFTGRLGEGVTVEQGQESCRLSFINVLAQLREAAGGDLDRVARVLRLGGFIACVPGFTQHAQVMNGASDLCVAVFGEAGMHARTTIGVPALPADAATEVEALAELA